MASLIDPGISHPTDFQINSLFLISDSGRSVDLRLVMGELNIFEDIFNSCIVGDLVISDSNNLINMLPLTGFEYLLIEFTKPSQIQKFTKVFRVYKITNRKPKSHQNEVYIIHFCSEEAILNESIRVSKIYNKQSIDAIVKDISSRYLNINENKFSISKSNKTSGVYNISIPNWRPFYAINWLSKMAVTKKYSGASYVFFENRDGFQFVSLEELSQQPHIKQFLSSNMQSGFETDSSKPDVQLEGESIMDYEILGTFDMLENISSGMFSSTLITVDPLRQRISIVPKSSSEVFSRTEHLNSNALVSDAVNRRKLPVTKEQQSFYRIYPTTLGHDKLIYAKRYAENELRANNVEQWLLQRHMYFGGIHTQRMNIAVAGDVLLTVGKTVDVKLPAILAQTAIREFDALYSGKYLITALRHSINEGAHLCYLELSKDSVTDKYPAALKNDAALNIIKES